MSDLNENLNDVIDDIKNEDGKMPQMINVLSILTFIGAGLGVLSGLLLLVGGGTLAAKIPGMGAAVGGNIVVLGLILLIANAACLYGAIQMRKLSKTGFYIYVAGHAIALIGGIAMGGGFNVMGLIFPLLFIGLYGSQLKNLK